MRYRPMPSRTPPRRRKQPMTSATIRLISRLCRESDSGDKSKTGKGDKFCD